MNCFHDFSAPLWGIFAGNLLLLFCSLFYLAWWVVSYSPNSSGGTTGGFFITAAFITGIAAIMIMAGGINSLPGKGLPVRYILLGAIVLFVVLLTVTQVVFRRTVTSELMIICIWAAVECSAIAVLQGSGRFGTGRAVILALIVGFATIIGLVCYILHYRLDETAQYWNGIIPLTADAIVMAVFLAVMAV